MNMSDVQASQYITKDKNKLKIILYSNILVSITSYRYAYENAL